MSRQRLLMPGVIAAVLAAFPVFISAQEPSSRQASTVDSSAVDGSWGLPSGPWISFAGSLTNEMTGFVFEQSERLAERASIKMCEDRGGGECDVEFTLELGCVAVVSGPDSSNWAIRPRSVDQALRAAIKDCGSDCRVVWSGCTTPRMKR